MLNSLPRHTLHDRDHILVIAKNKLPGPPKDSTRTRAHDWKHKAQHTLELHEHGNNIAVAKAYCLTPKLNSPFYANATIHSWSQWPLSSNALQMHHHFTNSQYIPSAIKNTLRVCDLLLVIVVITRPAILSIFAPIPYLFSPLCFIMVMWLSGGVWFMFGWVSEWNGTLSP